MEEFFGKELAKAWIQQVYDLALNSLKVLGKTSYAPTASTSLYSGIIRQNDYSYEDQKYDGIFDAMVTNVYDDKTIGLIKFKITLKISPGDNCEYNKVSDLSTIINIGTDKLRNKLLADFDFVFKDSLINDRFLIILKNIKIFCDNGNLRFTYRCQAIDEALFRPEGKYYEEIKNKTKVGKKDINFI